MGDADSSELDSMDEEYGEEEPQPVVTQHDVFGSDTEEESDGNHPANTREKVAPSDESSAEEEDEQEVDADDPTEDGKNEQTVSPSTPDKQQQQPPLNADSDSGSDQQKTTLARRKHAVGRHLFSDESDDNSEANAGSIEADQADSGASEDEIRPSKRVPHIEEDDQRSEQDVEEPAESEGTGHDTDERADQVEEGDEEVEEDNAELDETKIAVDFPLIRSDLGKDIHLVKMPNFLSVETRPFDPLYYEDELDEDDVMDEEGRTRLKLKVENTIRWRKNPENENVHESNARVVKWSDGSLSLHLGDEIFDIHKLDIQADYNYLFIREGSGLQGQSGLRTKLTFRPHSTDSFTHRKITLSLADKTNKSQKVKILPIAGADPETNRNQLVRREEEKLRASLRRESQLRRMRERQTISRGSLGGVGDRRRVNSGGYDDEDDDVNTTSLNALKRNAKASFKASRKDVSGIYSSDSESLSDISEQKPRKKVRATISDEDSD